MYITIGFVVYLSGLGKKTVTPDYLSRVLPKIVKRLPTELPRCIHCVGHPIEVLECASAGFDIFCCGWAQGSFILKYKPSSPCLPLTGD